MQTQGFDNTRLKAESPSLLSPTMQMSSYAAPLIAAHVVDTTAADAEAEFPPEAIVNWGDWGKGVRWALGIEAVTALVIFGAWQLWHLWQ